MPARDNPCIKTGCDANLGGHVWHGDLFDLGNYFLLNCNAGNRRPEEGEKYHFVAPTWYSIFQDSKVVIIMKDFGQVFSYDGGLTA